MKRLLAFVLAGAMMLTAQAPLLVGASSGRLASESTADKNADKNPLTSPSSYGSSDFYNDYSGYSSVDKQEHIRVTAIMKMSHPLMGTEEETMTSYLPLNEDMTLDKEEFVELREMFDELNKYLVAFESSTEKLQISTVIRVNIVRQGEIKSQIAFDAMTGTKDTDVGVDYTTEKAMETRLASGYKNGAVALSTMEKGAYGMPVNLSMKIPAGMKTTNLTLYMYDKQSGGFTLVKGAKLAVDSKGFATMTTTNGGDFVISDGELVSK